MASLYNMAVSNQHREWSSHNGSYMQDSPGASTAAAEDGCHMARLNASACL